MSVHAAGAPEGDVPPRPLSRSVAIGAPLRTNRRLEEVLAIGFANKMQLGLGANTAVNNLVQVDSTCRQIVMDPSMLRDQPPLHIDDDDEDLVFIKEHTLRELTKYFETKMTNLSMKEGIMERVSKIINDTDSWARQSAEVLLRGHDTSLEPEFAKRLVSNLRQIVGVDPYGTWSPWSAEWTIRRYNRNNELVSQKLLETTPEFFLDLIEKYNKLEPNHDLTKTYVIHYRFDADNTMFSSVFHMDSMGNRREYAHEPAGREFNFFAQEPVCSVAFCYDENLQPLECGSEVLIGTPVLKPQAMLWLSHACGGAFTREELVQMWGQERHVDQERGDDTAWQQSAWQKLAHVMQKSTEEIMKAVINMFGMEALFDTGNYQVHKVKNHYLHNYVNFTFHRSDSTAVDPAQGQVRGFVVISQTEWRSDRTYTKASFMLSDGKVVNAEISVN